MTPGWPQFLPAGPHLRHDVPGAHGDRHQESAEGVEAGGAGGLPGTADETRVTTRIARESVPQGGRSADHLSRLGTNGTHALIPRLDRVQMPGEAIRITPERVREDLRRDLSPKLGVGGLPDLTHAALAEQRGDVVVAEARAGAE